MKNYNSLAKDIIAHVGGKENIIDLHHCVTRLRFNLADESKADDTYLKNLDGVITIMKSMGEYMVVIGEHVPYVYEEVCKEAGLSHDSSNKKEDAPKQKVSLIQRVLNVVQSAMGPSLNMICASGIIKGILAVLSLSGLLMPTDGLYVLLNAIGDAIFHFLPIMLGYNLAKKLEMEPFLGFLIGAALCYPAVNAVDINLFGYVVNATYTGSFLPVLFMVCLAAPLEKRLKKVVPELFRGFLAIFLTI